MQTEAQRAAKEVKRAQAQVNERLYQIGLIYHDSLPLHAIDIALTDYGFNELEGAIYCGTDGTTHEEVGHGKWLTLSWHKMESGRYEVTAYLN